MEHSNENGPENQGNPAEDNEPTAPKIGNLDDPFDYAPKRPDRDHWENLLRPLFEKDKAQCDIWKDEVSNLLIFAGLFSAVVTAFIVESYKGLQRDPNQDMIILLSQIADRLSDNTSVASTQLSGPLRTFSPTSSSIRINIFWFISLILSLTTVLVGIISLQWLREHQNYATLTPREQYAIFHMRREGLEKWHVGKIFTVMPILLQSALVLFFTGMIDFLLAFGDIAVAIPVTVVIGLSLLFLLATTLLPTLQGFCLFFKVFFGGHRNIPVQCPYKSPQSNTVRAISLPIFTVLHFLHGNMGISRIGMWLGYLDQKKKIDWLEDNRTFVENIHYSDRTWLTFDLQWLAIRDGFMRRAFNRPLEEYEQLRRDPEYSGRVPIWDILQGLVSQTRPDTSSAYYAYMEVSAKKIISHSENSNAYLYDAVKYSTGWSEHDVCFYDFYQNFSDHTDYRPMARYQTLYKILDQISRWDGHSGTLRLHMGELYLRLMEFLLTRNIPIRPQNEHDFWPDCLMANHNFFDTTGLQVMLLQLITTLFKQMSREYTPNALVNVLCARQKRITDIIRYWTFGSLNWMTTDLQIQRAISALFDVINEILVQEIRTVIIPGSGNARATLLFYAAALCVYGSIFCAPLDSHVRQPSLETLLSTIHRYKNLTIDKGMSDADIENQCNDRSSDYGEFSANWWSLLLRNVPPLDSSIMNDILHNNSQPLPPDTSSGEDVILAPAVPEPHLTIIMDGPTDFIPG